MVLLCPSISQISSQMWGQMGENVAESVQKGHRVVVTGRLEQSSWETDSGDKRSKIEVVADEVAPSLRWATAQVQRIERNAAATGSGYAAPARPSTADEFGEEPF